MNDEFVGYIDPPLFAIDNITFKCSIAHPHIDYEYQRELFTLIDKAIEEFTKNHNMSLGYSRITEFIRKER